MTRGDDGPAFKEMTGGVQGMLQRHLKICTSSVYTGNFMVNRIYSSSRGGHALNPWTHLSIARGIKIANAIEDVTQLTLNRGDILEDPGGFTVFTRAA